MNVTISRHASSVEGKAFDYKFSKKSASKAAHPYIYLTKIVVCPEDGCLRLNNEGFRVEPQNIAFDFGDGSRDDEKTMDDVITVLKELEKDGDIPIYMRTLEMSWMRQRTRTFSIADAIRPEYVESVKLLTRNLLYRRDFLYKSIYVWCLNNVFKEDDKALRRARFRTTTSCVFHLLSRIHVNRARWNESRRMTSYLDVFATTAHKNLEKKRLDSFKKTMIEMFERSGLKKIRMKSSVFRNTIESMIKKVKSEIVMCVKTNFTSIALLVAEHTYGVPLDSLPAVKDIIGRAFDFSGLKKVAAERESDDEEDDDDDDDQVLEISRVVFDDSASASGDGDDAETTKEETSDESPPSPTQKFISYFKEIVLHACGGYEIEAYDCVADALYIMWKMKVKLAEAFESKDEFDKLGIKVPKLLPTPPDRCESGGKSIMVFGYDIVRAVETSLIGEKEERPEDLYALLKASAVSKIENGAGLSKKHVQGQEYDRNTYLGHTLTSDGENIHVGVMKLCKGTTTVKLSTGLKYREEKQTEFKTCMNHLGLRNPNDRIPKISGTIEDDEESTSRSQYARSEWLVDHYVPDLEKVEYIAEILRERGQTKFGLLAIDLGTLVPASCVTARIDLEDLKKDSALIPKFAKIEFYTRLREITTREIQSQFRNRNASHERSQRPKLKAASVGDTQSMFRNATSVEEGEDAVNKTLETLSKKRPLTSDTSRKKQKRSQNIQRDNVLRDVLHRIIKSARKELDKHTPLIVVAGNVSFQTTFKGMHGGASTFRIVQLLREVLWEESNGRDIFLTIDEAMTTKSCFCGAKWTPCRSYFGIPRPWISRKTRQQYKTLKHSFDMYTPHTNTGSEDHDNLACPVCLKCFPRDPKSASLVGLLLLSYMLYAYRPYCLQRTCDAQVVQTSKLDEYVVKSKEVAKRKRSSRIRNGHEHTFTCHTHEISIGLKNGQTNGKKFQIVHLTLDNERKSVSNVTFKLKFMSQSTRYIFEVRSEDQICILKLNVTKTQADDLKLFLNPSKLKCGNKFVSE